MEAQVSPITKVELTVRELYDLNKVIDLIKEIDRLFYTNDQTADLLWNKYSFSIDTNWMENLIRDYNTQMEKLKINDTKYNSKS